MRGTSYSSQQPVKHNNYMSSNTLPDAGITLGGSLTDKICSFDLINNLSPYIKQIIRKRGENQIAAPDMCRNIWFDFRKTDLTLKGIVNYITFESIYNKYKDQIITIQDVVDCKDLFDLCDDDNDGFMNEDEQILLFSIIKAKMIKISKELLIIYEYALFSKLMQAIKDMERIINQGQNQMRKKIYSSELDQYHKIGYEKLEHFFQHYERKLKSYNEMKTRREEDFFMQRNIGKDNLQTKLSRVTEGLKFKPRKKLRDYQTQERLVALEERVEEATNFRKELKILNVDEANRLTNLYNKHMENSLTNYEKDTRKLFNHLNVKLANELNKIKIKLAKDYDILQKQIALHENDIKRIQNLSIKKALSRGETLGELYRLKATLRNQNEILQNAKKIDMSAQFFNPAQTASTFNNRNATASGGFSNTKPNNRQMSNTMGNFKLKGSQLSGYPSITPSNAQRIMNMEKIKEYKNDKELIKFYVRQKFGTDIPVNVNRETYYKGFVDEHYKVEKYLTGADDEVDGIQKLCHLYDEYQGEIPDKDKNDLEREQTMQLDNAQHRKTIYDMLKIREIKSADGMKSTSTKTQKLTQR